ncbi:polyprenyl synthetase family protein, partial [Patescibacteria group bacterium]|nr:polyprenyl synthetase family protein [Patescibacteria group bacterium]
MDIQKIFLQLQKKVNQRLELFFDRKAKELKNFSPLTKQLFKEIKDFSLAGGKRIRPIFLYYGYLAGGGKNKKAILDASICVELIHNYLLIHDDIIDKDEFRRGKPTIHEIYRTIYQKKFLDSKHLGVSAGILAGDFCSVFGYDILVNSKFPLELKLKAIQKLNQILIEVVEGEMLDVFLGLDHQLSQNDIFKILEYKSARYTVEGPLHLGAILAGANGNLLKRLSQYAIPLGIAFQIQDDILGMFGEPKKTCKPSGNDLKEAKQTILILKARQLASPKQRKIINT